MRVEPRGFGFVTFVSAETIDYVLEEPEHYIDGKLVECKKAVPKDTSAAQVVQPQPKYPVQSRQPFQPHEDSKHSTDWRGPEDQESSPYPDNFNRFSDRDAEHE